MKPLETDRLVIRNWQERDRALFYEINSDDAVMAYFPFRRTRAQSDAFFDRLRASIAETGIGFTALELKATGETIGFAGLHRGHVVPGLPPATMEIGWRLAKRHWGKGYVTEAGIELLRFGFEDLAEETIVSFAVHDNHRSTAVMERLGMRREPARDFDHPTIPASHPHLRRHVVYMLTRQQWLRRTAHGRRTGRPVNPSAR